MRFTDDDRDCTTIERMRHIIRRHRYVVDIYRRFDSDHSTWHTEKWTDKSQEALISEGYSRAIGLKTGWAFMFESRNPVYVRFWHFEQHEIDPKTDCLDTSATLYDYVTSNAEREFRKGMEKITMGDLDLKKLVTIGIIAVGIVIGLTMVM